MNVIFLDIDGTLNYNFNKPKKWNKQLCSKLNDVLLKHNIKIVITSTWRHHFTLYEFRKIFNQNNITAEIIGATGSIPLGGNGRGSRG